MSDSLPGCPCSICEDAGGRPQPDDPHTLRDRIAYVIAQADGDLLGMTPDTWDYALADAVIAALEQHWRDGNPTPWARQVEITKWSGDE